MLCPCLLGNPFWSRKDLSAGPSSLTVPWIFCKPVNAGFLSRSEILSCFSDIKNSIIFLVGKKVSQPRDLGKKNPASEMRSDPKDHAESKKSIFEFLIFEKNAIDIAF